jgi:hypothetical protein
VNTVDVNKKAYGTKPQVPLLSLGSPKANLSLKSYLPVVVIHEESLSRVFATCNALQSCFRHSNIATYSI